jgi:ligand-binding sensor domain-containing protein
MAFDGTLWVSSCDVDGGVSHFDGHNWKTYDKHYGLGDDCVEALSIAPDGIVWAGTASGATKFDGTLWTNFTTTDGLVDNKINTIAVDQKAGVWIGTDVGVSHFEEQNGPHIQRTTVRCHRK